MRIIIQRVKNASVYINKKKHSSINQGLLCFVGFCHLDSEEDFAWSINKLLKLKLFNNSNSLEELGLQLLIVSQFTLFASTKKGSKPSWSRAANPILAKRLYNKFVDMSLEKLGIKLATGVFGADMQIESINDGPVTLILDSKQKE